MTQLMILIWFSNELNHIIDAPYQPEDIYASIPSTEYPGHPDAEPSGYKEKTGGYEQGFDPYSY